MTHVNVQRGPLILCDLTGILRIGVLSQIAKSLSDIGANAGGNVGLTSASPTAVR
jgi:hypothetical protein